MKIALLIISLLLGGAAAQAQDKAPRLTQRELKRMQDIDARLQKLKSQMELLQLDQAAAVEEAATLAHQALKDRDLRDTEWRLLWPSRAFQQISQAPPAPAPAQPPAPASATGPNSTTNTGNNTIVHGDGTGIRSDR